MPKGLPHQRPAVQGEDIALQRGQRSDAELLTRYFEVHFDDVAAELSASGPQAPGPEPGSVVRQRQMAAAQLRQFVRGLIALPGGAADREAVMSVVVGMHELTDFQRDMLRARVSAVLDRAEAKPEAPDVLRGAAARGPAREDEIELEPDGAATATADAPPRSDARPDSRRRAGPSAASRPAPGPAHSPTIASVLSAVALKCLEDVGADLCQVFIVEDEVHVALRAEAPTDGGPIAGPGSLSTGEGFASKLKAAQEPLVLESNRDLAGDETIWLERGIIGLAGVSLGTDGEPGRGILVVGRTSPRRFGAVELEKLSVLAAAVTLAISSAEMVARAEELAVLKERMKLAREIHDGLANDLSAVVALFKYHEQRRAVDPKEAEGLLVQMRELTEQSLRSARDILATLRPRHEVPRLLSEAVRRHIEDFSQTYGITAITRILGLDDGVDEEERDALFQVLREALTNVRKHSEASVININLDLRQRPFSLLVEDDGVGIDVDGLEDKAGSFGLVGMRERAELLGGSIEISHSPMGGARVAFYGPPVPLAQP